MKATTADAYELFHQGSIALAQVEQNGIRIDEAYLEQALADTAKLIRGNEQELQIGKVWKAWRKEYADKANLGSREQLAHILFDILGHPCSERTGTGRPKANEKNLLLVSDPFVHLYLYTEKLKKLRSTYLMGIKREMVDGVIHPSFNLGSGGGMDRDEEKGGARSYRSSCSLVNVQNIPTRNPELAEIIRRCYIPRDGHRAAEIDYSAIEVRIMACYSKDRALIRYIEDPTKDMHRDQAVKVYCLKKNEVSEHARYCAKNMFVFPQFYGSVYFQCAPALWDAAGKQEVEIDGNKVNLQKHLKRQGFKTLGKCEHGVDPEPGTYEYHVAACEREFWQTFHEHRQWRKRLWESYCEKGYVDMLTGFRCEGLFRRNQISNMPPQGSAFHCVLWSLISGQKFLSKKRSMIVNEVHDSLWLDVHEDEFDDVVGEIKTIMTVDLPRAWPWIIVPLEVEVEAAPVGRSFFEKVKV